MLSHAMKLGRSASVIPLARQQRVNAIGGMNCVVSQWTSPSSFNLQSRRMNSGEAIKSPVVDTVVTSLHPHYPAVESITTLTNSPPDLILNLIESTHIGMQIPYWESIVLLTIGMRCIMLPVGIKTAQSSARMAAVRPLLTKVTDAMKRDPNAGTAARKKQYADQSKELLKSYKVNPFLSLAMPFVQLPVFMSCFFALQKFGEYYPAIQDGGVLWFTDLAAADSTMILPILNSLSFLLMIELGSEGMAANDAGKFKWVMRGLAVIMTPITMTMPCGLFVYWTTNNALSVTQGLFMKLPKVRKYFGMPDPPKESASALSDTLDKNPIMVAVENLKKEFTQGDSMRAEIVDGGLDGRGAKNVPLITNVGPIPKTFSSSSHQQRGGNKKKRK